MGDFKEEAYWKREAPIYRLSTPEIRQKVAVLEQHVGPLPLSLKCWYEEVESINLVGLFPPSPYHALDYNYGSNLDPLFIYSMELVLQMIEGSVRDGVSSQEEWILPLSPDHLHKFGYSGSGPYHIIVPYKAIDAFLLDEPHRTTFINYLRICLQWGGFPGLETDNRLTHDELDFLTKDLLRF